MKIVWHTQNLRESEWLRYVFQDILDEEITDIECRTSFDNSIHVVSTFQRPLTTYDAYFKECRRRSHRQLLVHLGDEWFSGGYGTYRHFDGVVRNYYTSLADHPGIVTLPLGYPNGTAPSDCPAGAAERPWIWSFIGEIKASRSEMLKSFATLQPNLVVGTSSISDPTGVKVSKQEFDRALAGSLFSPCPMGNVVGETWRLYESLERGAIPIVEKREHFDYFSRLFGSHPIPSFSRWPQAVSYCREVLQTPEEVSRLQHIVSTWWREEKLSIRERVQMLASGESCASSLGNFATNVHNRYRPVHEYMRVRELIAHQSWASLGRRLSKPWRPLTRMIRESRAPQVLRS